MEKTKTVAFNNANPISNGIKHGISIDGALRYRAISRFSIKIPDSSCRQPLSLSRATIISLQPCVACQEGKITQQFDSHAVVASFNHEPKKGPSIFSHFHRRQRERRPSRVPLRHRRIKAFPLADGTGKKSEKEGRRKKTKSARTGLITRSFVAFV